MRFYKIGCERDAKSEVCISTGARELGLCLQGPPFEHRQGALKV